MTPQEQYRASIDLLFLRDALLSANRQLDALRALGTVYVYPDDWNCAKEGGSPTLEDCQQIDLETYGE